MSDAPGVPPLPQTGVRVLGIETSCDDTAVAVVRDGRFVESSVIAAQTDLHAQFGGVVPEQASRAHLRAIVPTITAALSEAKADWDDIHVIAVTSGPGLAGPLLVGLNAARGLAFARRKPLLGINHLEGHVYANWLEPEAPEAEFPLVALIVSGGHTDVILMREHGDFTRLGQTRDDAAGEAFDKVARMLGLGFPGGPPIEQAARTGDPRAFAFPRAWLERGTFDVSFSGLKTAVFNQLRSLGVDPVATPALERAARLPVADLAASFQEAVVAVLTARAVAAARAFNARQILLGGGVAANQALRSRAQQEAGIPVLCPRPRLCTDNGAMIAAAGYRRLLSGQRDGLDLEIAPSLTIGHLAGAAGNF